MVADGIADGGQPRALHAWSTLSALFPLLSSPFVSSLISSPSAYFFSYPNEISVLVYRGIHSLEYISHFSSLFYLQILARVGSTAWPAIPFTRRRRLEVAHRSRLMTTTFMTTSLSLLDVPSSHQRQTRMRGLQPTMCTPSRFFQHEYWFLIIAFLGQI